MSDTALQLRSLVTAEGQLELSLAEIEVPEPGPGDVLVRVEATPINPSDLGLLLAMADLSTVTAGERNGQPLVTADIPGNVMAGMQARVGQSLPVGNEGAGVVVAAGSDPEAQALMGRTVAILGGAMYANYRCMPAKTCLVLNKGTTSAQGASCFVNPLTALGMVETMRAEGHTALLHTAAASNLGQMLQKICLADGIELVNVVRKEEQADLLRSIGAQHVCNSSDPNFMDQLTDALAATNATIGFDATGGGDLAGRILTCMERAQNRAGGEFSRYGSTTHKQVYIYGGLERSPTTLNRNFGMAWGIGGWLLTPFLQKIGKDAANVLRKRVADEIDTTFASSYEAEISLAGVLDPDNIRTYAAQTTGRKYLVNPAL